MKPQLKIEPPKEPKRKTAFASSQCPCGKPFSIEHKKPKPFQPSIAKHTCECGSKFQLRVWYEASEKDGARQIRSNFEIIELSDEAKKECLKRQPPSGVYQPNG